MNAPSSSPNSALIIDGTSERYVATFVALQSHQVPSVTNMNEVKSRTQLACEDQDKSRIRATDGMGNVL